MACPQTSEAIIDKVIPETIINIIAIVRAHTSLITDNASRILRALNIIKIAVNTNIIQRARDNIAIYNKLLTHMSTNTTQMHIRIIRKPIFFSTIYLYLQQKNDS